MVRKLTILNLCLLAIILSTGIVNSQFAIFQVVSVMAQSVLTSLSVVATNPTLGSDPNFRRMVDFNCTFNAQNINSLFGTSACLNISLFSFNGQNVYGGGTNAKLTTYPMLLAATNYGAGQRFVMGQTQNCYGMGDCFLDTKALSFATADNVGGDEGIGMTSISHLDQQQHLTLPNITSVPAQTTCNTTITQNITGGPTAQQISVASTTNCNVNDWIVIGQAVTMSATSKEAAQITAVGGGAITAIYRNNHTSGATVTPAKVIVVDSQIEIGQQRAMVNLSGTTYSTGTVASYSGGSFTGAGTSWATNMVGGSATNIGCIQRDGDTYSGAPFNGSGSSGPLRSWYQINGVASATSLGVFSYSTAGDAGYHGLNPGTHTYSVKPCAEVLFTVGTTIVLETTTTTWTTGDSLEVAIPPYPDITGFQYWMSNYTPGGAGIRSMLNITNTGARTGEAGISIASNMPTGGGADTIGWSSGLSIGNTTSIGITIGKATTAGIRLASDFGAGYGDNSGKIDWAATGTYIVPNSPNNGMDFQTIMSGFGGMLSAKSNNVLTGGSTSLLNFTGMLGTTPKTFSTLPTCDSLVAGAMIGITDSNTATFNATIAGGGSNKGIAYCNGSNWTFH